MKNIILFLLVSVLANAQNNIEDFTFKYAGKVVDSTFYTDFEFIDSRENKENCGFIQKGAFNRVFTLQPKVSLEQQFLDVLKTISSSPKEHRTLVFQLKEFQFSELTEAYKETGYFRFSANLYEKVDSTYFLISSIDRLNTVNAMDVTNKNEKEANKLVSDFLESSLLKLSDKNKLYTYNQVKNIFEYEKSLLPLYVTSQIKTGVYVSYSDFKNQIPNYEELQAERKKNGKIKSISYKGIDGKYYIISAKNIYAYSFEGDTYVSNSGSFSKLKKDQKDYYIEVYIAPNSVYFQFGLIGAAIATAANQNSGNRILKLNYSSGEFVP